MALHIADILESPKLTPLICLILACLVLLYHDDRSVGKKLVSFGADVSNHKSTDAIERTAPASGSQGNACELPSCELVLQSRM